MTTLGLRSQDEDYKDGSLHDLGDGVIFDLTREKNLSAQWEIGYAWRAKVKKWREKRVRGRQGKKADQGQAGKAVRDGREKKRKRQLYLHVFKTVLLTDAPQNILLAALLHFTGKQQLV